MTKQQKELAKVIENYFGADAGYLDIDVFTLAKRILEAGWEKPEKANQSDSVDEECRFKKDGACTYGEGREKCEHDDQEDGDG